MFTDLERCVQSAHNLWGFFSFQHRQMRQQVFSNEHQEPVIGWMRANKLMRGNSMTEVPLFSNTDWFKDQSVLN